MAATLIDEIIALWLRKIAGNDAIIYVFFQPVEYALITGSYFLELKKKWLLWTVLGYIIIAIVNTLFLQNIHFDFGSNMVLLTMFLTSTWALLYLKTLLQYPTQNRLIDFTLFWTSFGLLLFNTSCILVYGTYNFIGDNMYDLVANPFRVIRVTANHLLYIMILLSFLNKQKNLRPD
ncbi:hypothetical protein GCM10028808_18670 [Spirosoma migulaei]